MKTNKEIEKELSRIQDESLLMPKMYSFDEVRKLVKFAVKMREDEIIKEIDRQIDEDKEMLKGDLDNLNWDIIQGHLVCLKELKSRIKEK